MTQQRYSQKLIEKQAELEKLQQACKAAKKQAQTDAPAPEDGNLHWRSDVATAREPVQPGGSPFGPTIGTAALQTTGHTSCPTEAGSTAVPSPSPNEWETTNGQNNLTATRQRDGVAQDNRPEMVGSGWMADAFADYQQPAPASPPIQPQTAVTVDKPAYVRTYGRMAAEAQKLRHELDFRLWLLIRWLSVEHGDPAQRNSVSIELVRDNFADDGRHAFTTWPNLRKQINRAIERGYLWYSKDRTRLYYRSEARVAGEVLGLPRLDDTAVHVPIEALTRPYVKTRAIFLDIFHSGRGDGFTAPLSRRAIYEDTGRTKHTQLKYEDMTRIRKRAAHDFVEDYTPTRAKQLYEKWQQGGGIGRCPLPVYDEATHKKFIGFQNPNQYAGSFRTARNSRKRFNRRLSHLRINGLAGSCGLDVRSKLYYEAGAELPENDERLMKQRLAGYERAVYRRVYGLYGRVETSC